MGFTSRLAFKKKQRYWNRYYKLKARGVPKYKAKRMAKKYANDTGYRQRDRDWPY